MTPETLPHPMKYLAADWRGSIGTKRDTITKAPTAGVVFDRNQYAHITLPYRPPNISDPYAIEVWTRTDGGLTLPRLTFAIPTPGPLPPYEKIGSTTNINGTATIAIAYNSDAKISSIHATLIDADGRHFNASQTNPPFDYPWGSTTTYPDDKSWVKASWNEREPIPASIKQMDQRYKWRAAAAWWKGLSRDAQRQFQRQARAKGLTGYQRFMKWWFDNRMWE